MKPRQPARRARVPIPAEQHLEDESSVRHADVAHPRTATPPQQWEGSVTGQHSITWILEPLVLPDEGFFIGPRRGAEDSQKEGRHGRDIRYRFAL